MSRRRCDKHFRQEKSVCEYEILKKSTHRTQEERATLQRIKFISQLANECLRVCHCNATYRHPPRLLLIPSHTVGKEQHAKVWQYLAFCNPFLRQRTLQPGQSENPSCSPTLQACFSVPINNQIAQLTTLAKT